MASFGVQKLLYPLYQSISGRRIISQLDEFERNQWLARKDIDKLQSRRLNDLLMHAYQHVPFYRNRIDGAGLKLDHIINESDLRHLPLLTKEDILSERDQLIADNYSSDLLKLNASGGSTGHTISFYNDRSSLDTRSAVTIRGDRWAGLDIGTPHARLWGAPLELRTQRRLINRIRNFLLNRLWLDCFRLSDAVMISYVEKLRKFKPQILMGYATALSTFARFLQDQHITDILLKGIISSAETLLDEQRQLIEGVFGCKVYNRYGCREAGPLACECPHGRLHLNADFALTEIIKDGNIALPGETGEIILTPLFGYGMPLIRYSVGDLGVASDPQLCPCGRGLPTIERIVGRTSDMLMNAHGDLFHGEYFTHLFYNQPGVRQFQVIQPDRYNLQFKLVSGPGFDPQMTRLFEAKIHDFMGPINITWEQVKEISPLPSGKKAFTISLATGKDRT